MKHIKRIEFAQEGDSVFFFPDDKSSGEDIAKTYFEGCTDYLVSPGVVVVKTQSLQEMSFVIS